ncbi:MAG: ATP-binding protein [Eubacteriales bacterium]|nr:ATP-binding protein [Eubacteriales bacterium]
MEIIKGKIPCAKKITIYGPEGIGKSTFASQFPDPVFIDTEGSTKNMDVARFKKPSSWTMLMDQVEYVRTHPEVCRTLIIDTIDWAEMMCVEYICDKHHKDGLESFGYGNGYVYTKEEFGRFLNKLSDVVDVGVNAVLTAHAQIRKFEQPDEMGAYDRWELKLGKKTSSQTSPLVKEWSDILLFANYKTYSIATDDKGKKHKAQGGKRVMYTTHHPCWDAKNRYGLPDECEFDYSVIRQIIESSSAAAASAPQPQSAAPKIEKPPKEQPAQSAGEQMTLPINQPEPAQDSKQTGNQAEIVTNDTLDKRIPKKLRDLMLASVIGEWSLQSVVQARLPGAFPDDMQVKDYPQDFIDEWILPNWDKIVACAKEMREKMEIPFN